MVKKPTYEELERRVKELEREVAQHEPINEALRKTEERYQTLYRNTPAMLHSIDRNGRLIEVSDHWLKVLGYRRNEAVGRHLTDFMTDESREFALRIVLPEFFRGGFVDNIPYQFVKKGGQIVETLLSATTEKDATGEPIRSLAIVNDVTERIQIREKLQKRTHDLHKRVRELNCLYEISHLYERQGRSLEKILQGVVELIPQSCQYPAMTCARIVLQDKQYLTKNFEDAGWKQMKEIFVHDEPIGRVEVCSTGDGPLTCGDPFPKGESDFLATVSEILGGIIEHSQIEEALQESSRLNELLLNSLPYPAMLIRKDRVVLAANRIAREVGAEIGNFCWRSFGQCEYIPDHIKEHIHKQMGNGFDNGIKCTFCLADEACEENKPANDPEVKAFGRLWDTWWIPIEDDAYLHYAIDITERRSMEEQVRYQLAIEEAVAFASRLFLSVNGTDLHEVLRVLGEAVSVSRAYVFQLSQEDRKIDNIHEWQDCVTQTRVIDFRGLNTENFSWWMKKIASGEDILIEDVNTLSHEATVEKEILQSNGVCSLLAVPIYSTAGTLTGYIGFDDMKNCRTWRDEEIRALHVMAHMVGIYLDKDRVETFLRESEEKYRMVVENASEAIVIVQEGMARFVNSIITEVTGYSKDEFMSRPLLDVVHPDDKKTVRSHHLETIRSEISGPDKYTFRYIDKTENVRWAENNSIRLTWEGGPASLNIINDVTERKQAEDALRRSERQYRLLADNVTDVIWTMNMDRLITYVSPSVKHLLGYDVEEITLRTMEKALTPASYETVRKIFEEKLTPDEMTKKDAFRSIEAELELKHKDGSCIFTDTRMTVLRDSQGRPTGIVGSTRDITERKQVEKELQNAHDRLEQRVEERTAELSKSNDLLKREIIERKRTEKRLRKSEARLAEAQRIAHLGNWDWDVVNDDLWWSDEVYRIFGLNPLKFEATYEAFLSRVHPEDREFVNNAVDESLYAGRLYSIDHRINLPDGTERIVHEQAGVATDISGRSIRMTGTVQDVTERKRAEESLAAERFRLFTLLDELPGFVYLQSPDYSIRFSNRYFRQHFGEPGGRRCYEVLGKRNEPCKDCKTFRVFETKTPQQWEWPQFGNGRTYQIYDYPFNDIDGSPLVLELGVDITERKRAEEALQESETELRNLSSRLLNTQEEERKRIALELHDGIGQTLSAVKFKVEAVLRGVCLENLERVRKPLERLIPMIQESIEETRRISVNLRPSILDDLGILPTILWLCREVQTIYASIHIEKQFEIEEKDVPGSLKTVIYRVLREALNNSAKYSQADSIRLSLKKKGNNIHLTVSDNGVGFDTEDVISPEPSKRKLGLTSMKERTELSGGAFFIDSRKGEGTIVNAVWPLEGENQDHSLSKELDDASVTS